MGLDGPGPHGPPGALTGRAPQRPLESVDPIALLASVASATASNMQHRARMECSQADVSRIIVPK